MVQIFTTPTTYVISGLHCITDIGWPWMMDDKALQYSKRSIYIIAALSPDSLGCPYEHMNLSMDTFNTWMPKTSLMKHSSGCFRALSQCGLDLAGKNCTLWTQLCSSFRVPHSILECSRLLSPRAGSVTEIDNIPNHVAHPITRRSVECSAVPGFFWLQSQESSASLQIELECTIGTSRMCD